MGTNKIQHEKKKRIIVKTKTNNTNASELMKICLEVKSPRERSYIVHLERQLKISC